MEKITQGHHGSLSLDMVQDNISKLKQLFPELITEDASGAKIDVDVLKELVGYQVIDGDKERYNFTWHGKAAARRLAQTPSTGTLRPCKEESKNWDTTQNLFIEGDNLEVLKLLQKSYHKKVKMIYIDPPYNTGKDFIYPDNYRDNIKNYLELTGQVGEEGHKLSANSETSGRYHTHWLSMMYPRLKLARNLIKEDGFIAVSIDDAEIKNMLEILNDIFGEQNHLATLCWDKNRKNDAKFFSVGHEYMIIFAKNKQLLKDLNTELKEPLPGIAQAKRIIEESTKKHNSDWDKVREDWLNWFKEIPLSDPRRRLMRYSKVGPRGPYRDDGNISWPGGGGPQYEVLHPITNEPVPVPGRGWVYPTAERFWEEYNNGKVVFGDDHQTSARIASYLFESNGQVMPSVFYSYAQTITQEFIELMGDKIFDNPKGVSDLYRVISYLTLENDLVLDFFSGSCTTAHAVMKINSTINKNLKFIMVQLPEPCNKKTLAFNHGFKKISEIGKERIKLAGVDIQNNQDTKYSVDTGFKSFKLDSSNIKPWDADFDNVEDMIAAADDSLKKDRSADDVLYEILLKYGLDLTLPIEEHILAGKTVHNIGNGALMICLDDEITLDVVNAIGGLKKELQPEVMRVVFKDAGFADPVVKTNAIQVLKQFGIDDVKSI